MPVRVQAPDDEGRAPDLRLVPAALAAWAVVLLGLGLGPLASSVVGVFAAAVAVTAWRRAGVVAGRRAGVVAGRRAWAPVVLAVAGCAAAAALVVTAHAALVATHPLRGPAERAASATLRVVVSDDPRPVRAAGPAGPGGSTLVTVPAGLVAATVDDGRWTTGGRVLLLAPAQEWSTLLPGQAVTAEGLLAPAARSDLTIAVLRVRGPPQDVAAPPWWQSVAGGLRAGLRDAAAVLPPDRAGLLPGLAVGDTGGLTPEVEADFRAAGLTHLLVVSGANLAILSGAVLGLLRLLRTDPRLSAVLSGATVLGFVVLARPSPSVVRAAVMAAVVLLALGSGRGRAALPALAAAVLVLLLVDPALALDPGFALSVVATAALVLLAPGWARALRRRRVPSWVAEALAVPAAAFLATAPLVAGLSGQVGPIAVLANLLAVPAVAPATVLGVLAALLSPIAAPLAQACAWAAGPAVWWLVTVAHHSAVVSGAAIPWPAGVVGAVLLASTVAVLLLLCRFPRPRAVVLAVLLGLSLVLVPTRLASPGWPPTGWVAVACDVGQGDAIVLATGRPGWAVLVDAGPDGGLVDACLSRLGVQALALVVFSHLHADHSGGIAGALRDRPVGAVGVGPVREPAWALRMVARTAQNAGAPLVSLSAGQRLTWPALTLDVLGPQHPAPWVDPDDGTAVDDGSVVMRATTAAGSILLPGDVELAAQADLLDADLDLRTDVLKMPHHGSRYSSASFLNAVAARAVLVSVGAGNPYGHPNLDLMRALERAGALLRRTDLAGDVAVVTRTDGADPEGRPALALVTRGDPLPARRRRSSPVRSRGPPGRPARPCWWRAPSRSGRRGPPRRRGS